MPSTAEGLQIVLTVAIGVPEVEQSPANRLSSTIENKAGQSAGNTCYSRFAKVSLKWRVGQEERSRCFLWRWLKLLTNRWSGLKLDHLAATTEHLLNSRDKGYRGSRDSNRMKESPP